MNSIHNNGPDDKLLNEEIEELGHTYQQLSPEEPPELLDQAILNSAHRAVEQKDHWLDFGWIHGLTTAAVIVLALSIILTQRQPTELEENGLSPAAPTAVGRTRPIESKSKDEVRQQRSSAPATREARDDSQTKKTLHSRSALLEEDKKQENMMQKNMATEAGVSSPTEAGVSSPTELEFADEVLSAKAPDDQIGMLKTDADKARAEQSAPPSEKEQLQAILMLKQAGDARWKEALRTFTERYPDYPLPDELTD